MFVRLLTPRVGDRFAQQAGQVIEVDQGIGERLIAAQQAVAVEPGKENAALMVGGKDTAAIRPPKPRRRNRGK